MSGSHRRGWRSVGGNAEPVFRAYVDWHGARHGHGNTLDALRCILRDAMAREGFPEAIFVHGACEPVAAGAEPRAEVGRVLGQNIAAGARHPDNLDIREPRDGEGATT